MRGLSIAEEHSEALFRKETLVVFDAARRRLIKEKG